MSWSETLYFTLMSSSCLFNILRFSTSNSDSSASKTAAPTSRYVNVHTISDNVLTFCFFISDAASSPRRRHSNAPRPGLLSSSLCIHNRTRPDFNSSSCTNNQMHSNFLIFVVVFAIEHVPMIILRRFVLTIKCAQTS